LIADIHTIVPTEDGACEGHVLNEATGAVNLVAIAIEDDGVKVVYLGPVMSHYEFLTGHDERLTDDEWKARKGSESDAIQHLRLLISYTRRASAVIQSFCYDDVPHLTTSLKSTTIQSKKTNIQKTNDRKRGVTQ
jgi:hypothetical protein